MPEISPGKTVSFTHMCSDGSRIVYELPDRASVAINQSSIAIDEDDLAIDQSSVGVDEDDVVIDQSSVRVGGYKPRACVRLYHFQDSEVIERSIPVPVAKYLIKDTSYSSLDAFEKRLRSIEIIYAHATCARLVSVRERTQHEITTHLKREGYSPSVITAAVEQARQSDMVNDMRFCEVFSHSKMASGWGRKRIEHGLIRHGIERDEAVSFLNTLFDEDTEIERAYTVIVKKYAHVPGTFTQCVRFLSHRGFPASIAYAAAHRYTDFIRRDRQ